jgi:hypothetical protein
MKQLIRASAAGLVLASSGAAFAQQWSAGYSGSGFSYSGPSGRKVDNIGNAGQWVFGVERVTTLARESETTFYDDPSGQEISTTTKTTSLNLFGANAATISTLPRLALDYLVIDNVTVGTSLVLLTRSVSVDGEGTPTVSGPAIQGSPSASSLSFVGNVRAGFAFPFNETFGVWARGGVTYGYEKVDVRLIAPGESRETKGALKSSVFDLSLDAMAVLSPMKHFVIMGGPFVDLGLYGESTLERAGTALDDRYAKLTSYGLTFAISGYY